LAGSTIIILLAALLGLFVAESASMMTNADINLLPPWINVILGIIILYFGIKTSFKKDYEVDEQKVENRLKDKYSAFRFWGSVLLAIGIFTLNLITTILVFLASSQIAISSVNWMGKIISLILLVIITL
jgi:cadmium resistance protein CadD (predicted permease)